ncbi:MAG: ABC-F family ATP-binding cassette domain-containing protein [Candidatus Shapirobacteria bacterium]
MISIKDLSYSYGQDSLFKEASFFVSKNSKVGLVGQNGSGKSTLFKILTKKEHPDEGKVILDGQILLVPQEVKHDEELEKAKSIRSYLDPKNDKEDYELLRILSRLELAQFDLDDSPLNMSGGQKTKLAISRALIIQPDILLLDEPTNFLDIEGKKWVMNFLGHYPKTLIVISHDLNLLDQNIDKILNINLQTKKIEEYTGNYSSFVKLKEEQDALLVRQIHVQERHIIQMKKGWLKIAHARSEKGVRQKMNLERRIEKLEANLPSMPPEARKFKIKLPDPAWIGEMPIMAENICKSYGSKKVLTNVSFDIRRGERIALIGQNGAGKSTFIKILMDLLQADSGEIVKDEKIKIGYYSQEFETLDFNKNLLETMKEKCHFEEGVLRAHLGRFLFSGDRVFQKVGTLSGGEKTRLSIALLLVQNFNLLILDEPTTYLDVLSQRLILEAIKHYKGAMLIVSHTPEFIEELKPERKFLLPENKFLQSV